jgi:hypothetical protein
MFSVMGISLAAAVVHGAAPADWLLSPESQPVTVEDGTVGGKPAVIMSNGLLNRTFLVSPNWVTWSYSIGGDELLRSVQPEASFEIDNKTELLVGGVTGFINGAYLNASDPLSTVKSSYQYKTHRVVPIRERYAWSPGARHSAQTPWPPKGQGLEVVFSPPAYTPIAPQLLITLNSTKTLPTARQEWKFNRIEGEHFRLDFGKSFAGFQPFVNELQFHMNGAWVTNHGIAGSSIVVASSGSRANPGLCGKPWCAFDGNGTSMWDASADAHGQYWIDVNISALLSGQKSATGSSGGGSGFDGIALTTELSEVPGQGFYWRPRTVGVSKFNGNMVALPGVTVRYEMYEGVPAMSKTVTISVGKEGEQQESSEQQSGQCYTIRGLQLERLAMQETKLGRKLFFDSDWAWMQANQISLFTSYARSGPQYPCLGSSSGWEAGCAGGAGVFGTFKDPSYTTSYQYAWESLLVAGFPREPACTVRLPCIEETAAQFCMKFGPCPTGETDKYVWEQTLCPAGHQDRVSHHNPDHDHDQEQDHDQHHDQYRSTPPESFESFTVFELLHASSTTAPLDQERRGLETRRMFARLAPQVTENPVP